MYKNPSLSSLTPNYLFPEIGKRVASFEKENPDIKLIRLGIGDTTTPFPEEWIRPFLTYAQNLSTFEGYQGYGPSEGWLSLRTKIASHFYKDQVSPEEIFLSDGAKCDISRLQLLFSSDCQVALQDPAYPAYVDSSLLFGKKSITYLPCTKENGFFPDLSLAEKAQLLFINYPNNPTGAMPGKTELQKLVHFCRSHGVILIYDTAYNAFIQNSSLPKSIYEIEGAEEVAIEINSFSKMAGFTGVRLSWCVVPKALRYSDGSSIYSSWVRIVNTTFNGPSILAQSLAEAILSPAHLPLMETVVQSYLKRAKKLKKTLEELGFTSYGGDNCPYLWVEMPGFKNSWEAFDTLLKKAHLVTTPGSGFGPSGEGYLRMSAFAKEEQIDEACKRLKAFAEKK
jgi:LL-diaminopimelate aminotransferase